MNDKDIDRIKDIIGGLVGDLMYSGTLSNSNDDKAQRLVNFRWNLAVHNIEKLTSEATTKAVQKREKEIHDAVVQFAINGNLVPDAMKGATLYAKIIDYLRLTSQQTAPTTTDHIRDTTKMVAEEEQ